MIKQQNGIPLEKPDMKKMIPMAAVLLACGTLRAQTPDQIVAQYYPQYADKAHCRFNRKAYNRETGVYHCMKQAQAKTRHTAQGKQLYLLFTGRILYADSQQPSRNHPDKGMAGLFVFKKESGGWRLLAAKPEIYTGTFGDAPQHWRFEQFGKDKWGFVAEESETAQGYRSGSLVLVYHDSGSKISEQRIGNLSDTEEWAAHCETEESKPAAGFEKCMRGAAYAHGTMRVQKHGKAAAGRYPLLITVSSRAGLKKNIKTVRYVARYNAAKGRYLLPKAYPFGQ